LYCTIKKKTLTPCLWQAPASAREEEEEEFHNK